MTSGAQILLTPFADIPEFEYMRFAKTATPGARIALTASGMAPPPAEWLGDPRRIVDLTDAGHSGNAFLRERIAARYGVGREEVFITPGASAALHLVSGVLCSPGSRVVCETPAYPPLWLEPQLFGAQVEKVPRLAEERFRWDPGRVAKALAAGGRNAMVFCTSLQNPTGARTSDADFVALGERAAQASARLVCCELYGDFLGPDRPRPVATLVDGAVSIGSLTKAFGLGALRVGWILCRDLALIERLEHLFDHLDVNCPMPSMRAAEAVFDGIDRFEARALEAARRGWKVFEEWARRETKAGRVSVVEPAGGIVAFPRLLGVDDTLALARRVRERHGVQVTPGEFFGSPGSLRIGFGIDPAAVKEGLEALSSELPRG